MPLPHPTTRKNAARRLWLLALALFAIIVSAGFVASSSGTGSCGACHTTDAGGSQRKAVVAHRAVACESCHAPTGLDRVRFVTSRTPSMLVAAATGTRPDGPGTSVPREACLRCHSDVLDRVVEANGLRMSHASGAAKARCDSCHGGVGHTSAEKGRVTRTYVMETCVTCHTEQDAPKDCDTCHNGKRREERLETGPWQVTHGKEWRQTHGMGDLTQCATCHTAVDCRSCHGVSLPHEADYGSTHGDEAKTSAGKCGQCHDKKKFCDSCHGGVAMPHGPGYVRAHTTEAKTSSDPKCIRCHRQDDCDACHGLHVHPGNTNGTLSGTELPVIKR